MDFVMEFSFKNSLGQRPGTKRTQGFANGAKVRHTTTDTGQINVRFPLKENSGIHLIKGATTQTHSSCA
jgi:hypothetical protein